MRVLITRRYTLYFLYWPYFLLILLYIFYMSTHLINACTYILSHTHTNQCTFNTYRLKQYYNLKMWCYIDTWFQNIASPIISFIVMVYPNHFVVFWFIFLGEGGKRKLPREKCWSFKGKNSLSALGHLYYFTSCFQ